MDIPAPKATGIAWGQLPAYINTLTNEVVGIFQVKHVQANPVPGQGVDIHPSIPTILKQTVSFAWSQLKQIKAGDIITVAKDGTLGHVAQELATVLEAVSGPLHIPLPETPAAPAVAQSAVNILPEMPQYQSHKIVRAAQITGIEPQSATGLTGLILGELRAVMGLDWMRHFAPEVGGYLVEYSNGYVSYSPAKAFEEGYIELADIASLPPGAEAVATMRAKLVVSHVEQIKDGNGVVTGESLNFSAVGGDAVQNGYPADGNDEDNDYARWSPSASLSIYVANPALFGKLKQGDKYYVDFILDPKSRISDLAPAPVEPETAPVTVATDHPAEPAPASVVTTANPVETVAELNAALEGQSPVESSSSLSDSSASVSAPAEPVTPSEPAPAAGAGSSSSSETVAESTAQ